MKENKMKKDLLELAEKYELEQLTEKIESLNYLANLKVGFLGEFSTGKSTLLNAMIGKKILPVDVIPTTKSITHIVPKNELENEEFFKVENDGSLTKIDKVDFQDIATGSKEGKTELNIPANDILKESYFFVDTPGLASLAKADTDITFGYLPFWMGL